MATAAEMNDIALAEAIDSLRKDHEERIAVLERQVETLRQLIQSQTQVIGDTLQRVMGSGSTEQDR